MTEPLGRTGDDGFALIEVLVAFVIVTLGLVTLYSALGAHNAQIAESNLRRTTMAYAQSQLASIGHTAAARSGTSSGTYPNGTRWRASLTDMTARDGNPALPARPLLVVFDVFDGRGRVIVHLKTVTLSWVAP